MRKEETEEVNGNKDTHAKFRNLKYTALQGFKQECFCLSKLCALCEGDLKILNKCKYLY